MDEYFPIDPSSTKSFAHYIKSFYFKEFGFDPKKALLMDITKIKNLKNKNLNEIFPSKKVHKNIVSTFFCFPQSVTVPKCIDS